MEEIISLRKPREKHFLNEDGTYTLYAYDSDIHYLKKGKYVEIDNSIVEKEDFFTTKENPLGIYFAKKNTSNFLLKVEKDQYRIQFDLLEKNVNPKVTKNFILYQNILENLDIRYDVIANRIKDTIILKNKKNSFKNLKYQIHTHFHLSLNKEGKITICNENEHLFTIEKPTLMDKNNKSYPIHYILEEKEGVYLLGFSIENKILEDEALYPFVIDPALEVKEDEMILDTYIYPGDNEDNRGEREYVRVGVNKLNRIHRILLKFNLPTLPTASSIIKATACLVSHKDNYVNAIDNQFTPITVHKVTSPWTEENASWENMHDKYEEKIEDWFLGEHTVLLPDQENNIYAKLHSNCFSLTNLVKKWYAGEENNGVLLKYEIETYESSTEYESQDYVFYAKNSSQEDLKPTLIIQYRNQNGLENYMSYQTIGLEQGVSYINNLNGNVTNVFNIINTLDNKFPLQLNLIYNTNDVITNTDFGCGLGFKWNYYQTVKEVDFDHVVLEYLDEDGTLHYFYSYQEKDENGNNIGDPKILDEDGLGLTATKENDIYILKDKNDNQMEFTKVNPINDEYHLTKITNSNQNTITIKYNNDNQITQLYDGENAPTNVHYYSDEIEILNESKTTNILLENNHIVSIKTKYGTTHLSYNTQNIITKITDNNGLSKEYTYFDTIPYRLKKITEVGLNNKIGNSLEFQYEYNVTRVKNNKGRISAYTFNPMGNTIGITNLRNKEDFLNGYGIKQEYYENSNGTLKNKISLETEPTKYTNNLLTDSSFEKNVYPNLSSDFARTGTRSLKITNTFTYALPARTKTDKYTFSGYFKTNNTFLLSLLEDNQKVKETKILQNEDFVRTSISYTFDHSKNYKIEITPVVENSVLYMDDIQLEIGECPNYYNLIENSDFENGRENWNYSGSDRFGNEINNGEIISLANSAKTYTFHSKIFTSASLSQELPISGKKNDTYRLSFWYKNEGVKDSLENEFANMVLLGFGYIEEEDNGRGLIPITLNLHSEEWQFYEGVFTTEEDYNAIWLTFFSQDEVNNFSFTHVTLTKDLENNSYGYDEEGNLTTAVGKNKEVTKFKYDKKNQLTSIFEPKGNHFSFEYDNTNTNKVLQGISKKGIANKITYDEFHNPISTVIKNENKEVETIKSFHVRLKGRGKYMIPNYHALMPIVQASMCSNESWDFEKVGDSYIIKSSVIPFYLSVGTEVEPYSLNKEGIDYFDLIQNDNGSVSIKHSEANVCITAEGNYFVGKPYDKENVNQQFYLEPLESTKYIKTTAEYTSDGKFLESTTDALERTTNYNIDYITGLTKSITDPLKQVTNYTYNDKDQITKVEKNNQEVNYQYNEQDLLSKIICDNKEYNFVYDDFLNTKEIKINNQTLVTNEYETNNGNLLSSNYGNHTSVNYSYDEFDRIKTLTKGNKTYEYHYDNQNNLSKITNANENYKYYYDLAQRLSRYEFNNSSIDYDYDLNNNITKKIYNHNGTNKTIHYTYDEDDSIIKTTLDNIEVNFTYDELGRLHKKEINENLPVEYEYYGNGNKTSFVVKSMKIGNDEYHYLYDEVYNITDIYKNKELMNHYEYDNFNELIEDNNYTLNKTYKYTYDASGNILKKEEYELSSSRLLKTDTYEYNNTNWKDQLTKFNDTEITYDEIGNPITLGGQYFSWYGRELQEIEDNTSNIQYFYNKEGIRIQKKVNGIETNYFVENSNIVLEETNGQTIYYMRTDEQELIGFIYNNETYYYLKNYQGDIIGICDNNYNLICTYEYDSYGNTISIKNALGNTITEDSHIGNINPYRYRSYYYDKETGFYYLNSRYYNPTWGRFLNADGIIGTNETYLGYNLYVYCENNPIISVDSEGKFALTVTTAVGLVVGLLAVGTYYGTKALQPAVGVTGKKIENAISNKKARERAKEREKTQAKAAINIEEFTKVQNKKSKNETTIYRWGGINPSNLTPRKSDLDGLSFSYSPHNPSVWTTIEKVNSTGILKAYEDRPNHISVIPIGGTMQDWINQGSGSIWTGALKSVVVKWDGR